MITVRRRESHHGHPKADVDQLYLLVTLPSYCSLRDSRFVTSYFLPLTFFIIYFHFLSDVITNDRELFSG